MSHPQVSPTGKACPLAVKRNSPPTRLAAITLGTLLALFAVSPTARAVVPWTNAINTNFVVNILNYGAVGDGVTTNTVAISNAITAAAAGGATNGLTGGAGLIPAGIFVW